MYSYKFPMCSATATILVVKKRETGYYGLFGIRSANAETFPAYYCVPGGFMNVGKETIEQTAIRELFEETNVKVEEQDLNLFHVSSNPNTDPRAHVVNVCFYVVVDHTPETIPGDDLIETCWFNLESIMASNIAFDHFDVAKKALEILKKGEE